MYITCLQRNLKKALSVAERIIGKNLTLPILNNILISVKDKKIRISSTNLEIGINYWLSGKVEKEGELTIPAKVFSSFIGNLPNKKIELKASKDSQLNLKCENYKANFKGLSAKDFPIIPEITGKPIFKIKGNILRDGLNQVVGMAAFSESRPEISGIYFGFDKNIIKLVATDSFRLAEKNIENKIENPIERSLIIPQRTIQELIRVLSEEENDNEVSVILGGNQILFDIGYCQIISRLIDGQYPDYEQIIPKESKTQVVVKKDELVNAVRLASLFSSKINDVNLNISDKGQIEVSAKDIDLGDNKSQIKAEVDGKGLNISFNYRYLLDGLNNILSDKLVFNLSTDSSPVLIKPVGDKNYTYMIMPIKNN